MAPGNKKKKHIHKNIFILKMTRFLLGLTSKGGKLPEKNYPAKTIVSIYAENKENAIAVGITT